MQQFKLTEKRTCGHCGNRAPMQIVAEHSVTQYETIEEFRYLYGNCHEMLKCQSCDSIELRVHKFHKGVSEEEVPTEFQTLYPQHAIPDGLPRKVKEEYEKALKARHGDSNGYGVLLGRVLEAVFHDKKAQGKMLGQQLKDMTTRNQLPPETLALADKLNNLRIIGAHFNVGKLTAKEIPIMERLTKAILEYVYAAPYIIKQAEKALKKLDNKKNKISNDLVKITIHPPIRRIFIEGEPTVMYEEIEGLMIDCERQFLDLVSSQKVIKYNSELIPAISRSTKQMLSAFGYRDFILANDHDTHYLVPTGVDPKFSI